MLQVLEEVAEWVKVFDEVNVATALHRLAKLQPPGTAGPQSPVLRSAAFQLLVEACQRLVPRFEAQAVSNTMWGECCLGCTALSSAAARCRRAVLNVCYQSFARCGGRSCGELWQSHRFLHCSCTPAVRLHIVEGFAACV